MSEERGGEGREERGGGEGEEGRDDCEEGRKGGMIVRIGMKGKWVVRLFLGALDGWYVCDRRTDFGVVCGCRRSVSSWDSVLRVRGGAD